MSLVIVESPAKARTIERYLGAGHHVIASYGHIRDLIAKGGAVRPDEDFAMSWEISDSAKIRLKDITKAVKKTDRLILATDPDREGEAIAWHLLETLGELKLLNNMEVERIVFNAVTKESILQAMKQPRKVDPDLVDAYLARRALDYLVGFTLSPVLWRKLPGVKSAGRVQSAALRLTCEREAERETFVPQDFWTIDIHMITASDKKEKFTARLTSLDGSKLGKFTLKNNQEAETARLRAEQALWRMVEHESKPVNRRPAPPFTTSTLQQEASRKLGFSADQTMRCAQKLYDGSLGAGLITYMRTDGISIIPAALQEVRAQIQSQFGKDYLPQKPNFYKNRAKNAQEAHEAIRPTDISKTPEQTGLTGNEAKLYSLIWKRTIASQMAPAQFQQTVLTLHGAEKTSQHELIARATGRVLVFDGFLKVYFEGQDLPANSMSEEKTDQNLPAMKKNDVLNIEQAIGNMHTTQPPPRFTEASLVKRMEELGIGRPSTYAPTLKVLRNRNYVTMDKKQIIPESRGRIVTAFLKKYFGQYVDYNFTADLETQLDDISSGKMNWKNMLGNFWKDFIQAIDNVADLRISHVLDYLNEALAPTVFPEEKNGRQCPKCETGKLSIRIGRFGAFVGCANYPDCSFTRALLPDAENIVSDRELDLDPETKMMISVKSGRFGPYVERALMEGEKKPKRASIPKPIDPEEVDLETALQLLSLPRMVGEHPEDGKPIIAGLGRFGAYVKHETLYASLDEPQEVLSVGLNRALALLAEKKANPGRKRAPQGKQLGQHPQGGVIRVLSGRYGPYVKHDEANASIPSDINPEELSLEDAIALIDERRAKGPAKRRSAKKKTAKKKTAKKKN